MTLDGVFLIKKPQKFDAKKIFNRGVADPLKEGEYPNRGGLKVVPNYVV